MNVLFANRLAGKKDSNPNVTHHIIVAGFTG